MTTSVSEASQKRRLRYHFPVPSVKVIRAERNAFGNRRSVIGWRTMREFLYFCSFLLLGCGGTDAESSPVAERPGNQLPRDVRARRSSGGDSQVPTVSAKAGDPLPKDLRTRLDGSDWPSFLGPT